MVQPNRSSLPMLLALVLLALATVAAHMRFLQWDFDDSFIVYRMAENLSQGRGWSYNAGEAHNASTSVLNTVLIAGLSLITDDVPRAAHLLGSAAIFLAALALVLLLCVRVGWPGALVGALLLIELLARGAMWGLELHLFVAILLWIVLLETRGAAPWVLYGMAILTRPDALLLFVLRVAWELWRTRRVPVKGVGLVALVVAPWALFSLSNFGQLFPDTLSAKRWQGASGLWGPWPVYLRALAKHLLGEGPFWLPIHWHALLPHELSRWIVVGSINALALFGVLALLWRVRGVAALAALFVLLQQAAYLVLNVPGYHWYFSLLNVLLLIGMLTLLAPLIARGARSGILRFAVAVIAFVVCVRNVQQAIAFPVRDPRNEAYQRVARTIGEMNLPPGALAAVEVGTFGFFTRRPVVDLTGLVSRNPEYLTGVHTDAFFTTLPRIVVVHEPLWHFERAIADDVRFSLLYDEGLHFPDPFFPMRVHVLREDAARVATEIGTSGMLRGFIARSVPPLQLLEESPVQQQGRCILDQVNGMLARSTSIAIPATILTVRGWSAASLTEPADAARFVLLPHAGGAAAAMPLDRHEREDVAAHLADTMHARFGYSARASLLDLAPGSYQLAIDEQVAGQWIRCPLGKVLEVGPHALP